MNKIFFISISTFCILVLYQGSNVHFSTRVYLTSLFIQILSLLNIFRDNGRAYSLQKMFWLFSFFFFGVTPLIQFNEQTSSYGARILDESEYFFMNLLIIIILLLFQLFYNLFSIASLSDKTKNKIKNFDVYWSLSFRQHFFLLLFSAISFLSVFYINNFSVLSMLIRGGDVKFIVDVGSSTTSIIIDQVIRPMAIVSFFLYFIFPNRNKLFLSFLFIIGVITSFPLGMPRFAAAAMYIPFLILAFPVFRKKNMFSLTIIGGLLFIFPFLNNFRNFSKDQEVTLGFNTEMFTGGHFDSYQNFALIIGEHMVTWGNQLLGVLFFYVPRRLWPNKPVGSGVTLAETINLQWSNISANYFAEGYINFGYGGVFIFLVILAYILAKLDNMYWDFGVFRKDNFFRVFYYVLLGMIFFILRGDLLSSFAFTTGFMVAIYFVFKIVTYK